MRNDRNVMVNFKPSEYLKKFFFFFIGISNQKVSSTEGHRSTPVENTRTAWKKKHLSQIQYSYFQHATEENMQWLSSLVSFVKTEIDELRAWNTYRCHPPQNSQNNLQPSFSSLFRGSNYLNEAMCHSYLTKTYRVNICFQALLNWTQETGLDSRLVPAGFPRSFQVVYRGKG